MIFLTTKYAFFAGISIIINISAQYLILRIYNGKFKLYTAMIIGTLLSLIVKYILDKKYIFYYKTEKKEDDFYKFIMYSFMGVFTTIIFWGSELTFDYIFSFDEAKYLGAFIGLLIGYITKYFLDKKFVFNK